MAKAWLALSNINQIGQPGDPSVFRGMPAADGEAGRCSSPHLPKLLKDAMPPFLADAATGARGSRGAAGGLPHGRHHGSWASWSCGGWPVPGARTTP